MPKNSQETENPLSRGEAISVVDWLVNTKKFPPPRRGFYSILRLTPSDVAKKFSVSVEEVISAARRKVAEPA